MANFPFCRRAFPADVERTTVRDRILKTLPIYQWAPSGTLMCFAISLGYSDTYIRSILDELIDEELVERIEEGRVRGKPRYIWRLKPQPSNQ